MALERDWSYEDACIAHELLDVLEQAEADARARPQPSTPFGGGR